MFDFGFHFFGNSRGSTPPPPPPSSLLLDDYPSAGAYALRKLRSDYNGSCIRVRRESDNEELDIGFVNNELDVNAILNFAVDTNVRVVVWYNQAESVDNYDMRNTSATNQPRIIVTNNQINTDSEGNYAISFSSNNLLIPVSGNIFKNVNFACGFVVYDNSITSRRDIWGMLREGSSVDVRFTVHDGLTANRMSLMTKRLDADSTVTLVNSSNLTSGVKQRTDIMDYQNTTAIIRKNKNQEAINTSHGISGNTSDTSSRISAGGANNLSGIGNIFSTTPVANITELIIYNNSDILPNIEDVEQNQMDYYELT